MATGADSALVLLRSLWNKHVLLLRPRLHEAKEAARRDMMRRGMAVSGYAAHAECEAARKHLEAVLRATLADFQEQARPDRRTRRYVQNREAHAHLETMLRGEAGIAFGKLGPHMREADVALASDARDRALLQLEGVIESEFALLRHKLEAPTLDHKFWAEKRWTIAVAMLTGVGGWLAKTVVDTPAGQKAVQWLLHLLHLR